MLKKLLILWLLLPISSISFTQIPFAAVDYWLGSGSNEAYLFIDFNDSTQQECWAFAYRFDGNPTLQYMMGDIEAHYPWISFTTDGGFLNAISLGNHSESSGNPFYWMTFTLDTDSLWQYNSGMPELLADGGVYGCTYSDVDTSWNPLFYPENPHLAFPVFTSDSISNWVGTGNQYVLFLIDFNDGNLPECYSWGYRFDGTATAQQMLEAIQAADPNLSFNLSGGFLNDILYDVHSGLAGSPEYWSTFSGTNPYTWIFNAGLSTELNSGDWFGCSYTPYDSLWRPLFYPEYPVAASWNIGISENKEGTPSVFPNPCTSEINLPGLNSGLSYTIRNCAGQQVESGSFQSEGSISTAHLPAGIYSLEWYQNRQLFRTSFLKL